MWLLTLFLVLLSQFEDSPLLDSGDHWIYQQSTGDLVRGGRFVSSGYSGSGDGINNPVKEAVPDIGPIPRGEWNIGKAFDHATKGTIVMRLTPKGHKAHGRTGFLIHGDNAKRNRSASNGCIILSKDARDAIAKSHIDRLVVIE
jgi:hypothetical protein